MRRLRQETISDGTDDRVPPIITFVDEATRLVDAVVRVDDSIVGADVERADSDRYHRRAALVQVGDADACLLLDPLAVHDPDDLAPLATLLQERLVVLHAVENDIAPLDALGLTPTRLADTGIAAAMLGLPTGLTNLLHEVLDVELDTDKDRYQRADWEKRPLSQGMIDYAAGDVLHLPALWRALETQLDEVARTDWYEQELTATVDQARVDTRDWNRTKGAGRLDPAQRAVLRALWEERERLCAEHDIAPNRLLHDRTLVSLAEEPVETPGDLVRRNQRKPDVLRDHLDALFAAQERGLAAEPDPVPESRRFGDNERLAFDRLRKRRSQLARELGMDAGVLCPSRMLRDAVAAMPSDEDLFVAAAGMRPWQREVLGQELWATYVTVMAAADD